VVVQSGGKNEEDGGYEERYRALREGIRRGREEEEGGGGAGSRRGSIASSVGSDYASPFDAAQRAHNDTVASHKVGSTHHHHHHPSLAFLPNHLPTSYHGLDQCIHGVSLMMMTSAFPLGGCGAAR